MSENGIKSKVSKKFKATTNSNHKLPVAENILNRDFFAEKPNEKMVSDITYVWTDEGWLYVAAIMDLCGQKIVGLSMSERMTKGCHSIIFIFKNPILCYRSSGKVSAYIFYSLSCII